MRQVAQTPDRRDPIRFRPGRVTQAQQNTADTAERAYQLAPENAQVLDTLGWILANKGDVDRSVKLLRRAAELVPSSPVIRYHLAASLAKTGANVPARAELEALLKKDTAFRERPQAEALLKQLKN